MIRNNEEPVGLGALDRVTWALRRAELAVLTLKEQRLRPLGLAPAHYTLLMSVHVEPGLTGAELARRLNVTPRPSPHWWRGWRAGDIWRDASTRATGTCRSCTSPTPGGSR